MVYITETLYDPGNAQRNMVTGIGLNHNRRFHEGVIPTIKMSGATPRIVFLHTSRDPHNTIIISSAQLWQEMRFLASNSPETTWALPAEGAHRTPQIDS